MNAKTQQVSSVQALKVIVENLDSVAQRSLCSSIGFRPCVVCLVSWLFFPISMFLCSPSKPCSFRNGCETWNPGFRLFPDLWGTAGSLSMHRHLSLRTTGSCPSKDICSSRLDSPNTGNPSSLSDFCCDKYFTFNEGTCFVCEHTGLRELNFLIPAHDERTTWREQTFLAYFKNYLVYVVMGKTTSMYFLLVLFGLTFNPQGSVSSFTLLRRWCSFCSRLFWEGGRNPGLYWWSFPHSALAWQRWYCSKFEFLCKVVFLIPLKPSCQPACFNPNHFWCQGLSLHRQYQKVHSFYSDEADQSLRI